jgi:hypothetical protein
MSGYSGRMDQFMRQRCTHGNRIIEARANENLYGVVGAGTRRPTLPNPFSHTTQAGPGRPSTRNANAVRNRMANGFEKPAQTLHQPGKPLLPCRSRWPLLVASGQWLPFEQCRILFSAQPGLDWRIGLHEAKAVVLSLPLVPSHGRVPPSALSTRSPAAASKNLISMEAPATSTRVPLASAALMSFWSSRTPASSIAVIPDKSTSK